MNKFGKKAIVAESSAKIVLAPEPSDPRVAAGDESLAALHVLRGHAGRVLRSDATVEELAARGLELARLCEAAGDAAMRRAAELEVKLEHWREARRSAFLN